MGEAVAVGVVVAAGELVGVDPVSEGSPVVAGVVVALGVVLLPPSHAPKTAAKLNITAKPKIFVFITPLSPNCGIQMFVPFDYDNLFIGNC
ncbi:hypothetical protein NIES2109_08050 [Nostoc sp. HK-01]|uniref:Uncharacterized protein n=1 Tax=Nostoc cycadae WK-1 TaxID=1861711 RepID=A0A2H6LBS5_9NOSO|nr:hypothetical protein NIES2109_08050 [Nostoc sp. HK-01]GBE90697.1 hypothetical protein NCWK1_0416 [Nostoc cycadae WK-1]